MPFAEVKYASSNYATKPVTITPPSIPQPQQVYSLTPIVNTAVDGDTITFDVSADNVDDGTDIWFVIDEPTYFDGYTERRPAGKITITNEKASFNLTVDGTITTDIPVKITLRADDGNRPLGGYTRPVTARKTSSDLIVPKTITLSSTASATGPQSFEARPVGLTFIAERTGISNSSVLKARKNFVDIRIRTTNVPDGTVLYWDIADPRTGIPSARAQSNGINESDFSDDLGLLGSVTINNGIGEFRKIAAAGDGRESVDRFDETFIVNFRAGSNTVTNGLRDSSNPVIAKTGQIVIIDGDIEEERVVVDDNVITEPLQGTVDLSPNNDNSYSYDTRPILVFDDKLKGVYDLIKNSPDDNDEFLSKYVWEGDIYIWLGKDLFGEGEPEEGRSPDQFPSSLGTVREFRNRFYDYNVQNSDVANMKFVSEEIALRVRSRKIFFRVDGLKPNTRYFPKLGGIDISDYTIKESEYKTYSSRDTQDRTKLYTGETRHPELTSSNKKLITDSKGSMFGSFIIPNNSQWFFKVNQPISFLLDEDGERNRNKSFASTTYICHANQLGLISSALQCSVMQTASNSEHNALQAPELLRCCCWHTRN